MVSTMLTYLAPSLSICFNAKVPTSLFECMQSGMSVWHHEHNNDGLVVELHGNVHYLVCPSCEYVTEARPGDLNILKRCRPRICPRCQVSELRFKIMLYDDKQSEKITPEKVYERLESDLEQADLIIWVGISFEQVCCKLRSIMLLCMSIFWPNARRN